MPVTSMVLPILSFSDCFCLDVKILDLSWFQFSICWKNVPSFNFSICVQSVFPTLFSKNVFIEMSFLQTHGFGSLVKDQKAECGWYCFHTLYSVLLIHTSVFCASAMLFLSLQLCDISWTPGACTSYIVLIIQSCFLDFRAWTSK